MKKLLIFIPLLLFALDNQRLIECYKIFEQKKAELDAKAESIIEQEETLETLKNTYLALVKKKEKELKLKQKELNSTLFKISQEKKEIQNLIKKYKNLLQEIKSAKLGKIAQSYSKMRPNNAAQILEAMKPKDAIVILQKLPPRVLSKILANMDPTKAALYTEMLQKDNHESTNPINAGGS